MQEMMTADQAIRMFTRGTNMRWRVIRPDQVNAYQKNVFQLCLDRQCRQSVWVVPRNAVPSYDLYDRVMRYVKKFVNSDAVFIPKLKFDLDNLPTYSNAFDLAGATIVYEIKPDADIILQRTYNENPLSLSFAKQVSLKWSGADALKAYFGHWYKVDFTDYSKSGVTLRLGAGKNQMTVNVSLSHGLGNIKVNLPKSDLDIGNGWRLERHCGFNISIDATPNAPSPVEDALKSVQGALGTAATETTLIVSVIIGAIGATARFVGPFA